MEINWDDCLAAVREAKSIALFAHRNADGDAVGSLYAVAVALHRAGKEVFVFTEEAFDEKLCFLMYGEVRTVLLEKDGAGTLLDRNRAAGDVPRAALGIALDCAEADRMSPLCREVFEACPRTVKIDHHLPGERSDFADLNFADPSWAATAEGLYAFLTRFCDGVTAPLPDREIAIRLYTGILTDTGRFVYSNTTGNTLRTAAALTELAACDLSGIARSLFDRTTRRAAAMLATAYRRAEFLLGGKAVFVWLRPADFERAEAELADADAVVSALLNLEEAEIAVLAKPRSLSAEETPDGKAPDGKAPGGKAEYRISVRSTERYNAAAFCKKFGGGGHRCAAGCSFRGSAAALRRAVLAEFQNQEQEQDAEG